MKKNVMKTVVAVVCVIAAGIGSFKAYNTANQSEADLLLAENVEALSDPDVNAASICGQYCFPGGIQCWFKIASNISVCCLGWKDF